MKIIDCVQGSDEWLSARVGKVTASRVADVMAAGRGASRANYAAELVAERLTGRPAEKFVSGPMAWGTEQEPAAREIYAFATVRPVTPVGLVLHPTIDLVAASPDGLVGDDGLVEIKCPNTATHIDTLLGASINGKYIKQMQFQMACTGRPWCDFVSFDPRLPAEMQIYIKRVERDPAMITDIEKQVVIFLGEVAATVDALRAKYLIQQAAE